VEIDIKSDHFLQKKPVIVNGCIDICSKVVTLNIDKTMSTENAALNFIEHIYQWGLPNKAKTDNDMVFMGQVEGSAFGLFTKLCLFLGIEQFFIPIRRPKWNPHIERFFRTWDKEFFTRIYHCGWDALVLGNRGFVHRYLAERSHQSLKKLTNNTEKIKFPKQFHQQHAEIKLPTWTKHELVELVKKKNIPLVEGKVSFVRRVPESGVLQFKQNQFNIPKSYSSMMIKGTILVQPNQNKFEVELYFREHKLTSSTYYLKTYNRGRK
jgi:hypothetical protein